MYSKGESITSTSIETMFPPNSIGKAMTIPWGLKAWSLNYFNTIDDGIISGEPKTLQQDIDII